MASNEGKAVYAAINAVQKSLAVTGITKSRRNEQQGYAFRGIDDVFNSLSPLLSQHGLCILPRCTERTVTERQTKNGGTLFYVTVKVEFDLVAASDGSTHLVVMYGEAMDSGDKATNKAMSAAYKYACIEAFAIPTAGSDNDADATTQPEVLTKEQQLALNKLRDAALTGTEKLGAAWADAGIKMRQALADELPSLKIAAAKADAAGPPPEAEAA